MPIDKIPIRKKLLIAQNNHCYYCRKPLEKNKIHIDHMIPLSRGGSDDIDNLCLTCISCNETKSNKTIEEFEGYMRPYYLGVIDRKDLSEYNIFKRQYNKWHDILAKELNAENDINALKNLPPPSSSIPISFNEKNDKLIIPIKYFQLTNNKEIIFIFGKHKGKRLSQVLNHNKDYILWMLDADFPSNVKDFLKPYIQNRKSKK